MAGRTNAARARRINAAAGILYLKRVYIMCVCVTIFPNRHSFADFNTAMKIAQVARSGDIRMLTSEFSASILLMAVEVSITFRLHVLFRF